MSTHRMCVECGRQVAVRPNGLLRAHPATPRVGHAWDHHCPGSGTAAVRSARSMRLAYLELLFGKILKAATPERERDLFDRIERTLRADLVGDPLP